MPVIEGSTGNVNSVEEAKKIGKEIGYPILIKAAGGGGGKGMKVVNKADELEKLFPLAKLEAKKYFNNDKVYLGPSYNNDYIEKVIHSHKNLKNFNIIKLSDEEIYNITADKILNNLVIGWFKGRMEWGPRALGNRSILANPMNKNIKDILNLKIKLREKFRPFAPSVLYDKKDEYFKLEYHSPYMLNVVEATEFAKQKIPAVVHVDNTCRVQTVKKNENLHYYNLIDKFYEKTGVPVLVNTSFNENEPIVQKPEEALNCFIRTNMDFLVMENWTISR